MTISTDPNFQNENMAINLFNDQYTSTIQITDDINQYILLLNHKENDYIMLNQDLTNGFVVR